MQTAANSSRGLFASRSSTPSGWHPDEYPDVKFNLGVDPTDFLAAAEKVAQELTQKSFTNPRPNCTIICATLYEGLWVAAVMPIRRPIPKAIEHAVLMINQSVCCICRKPNVQIHHIDGNPANNKPSNLCVLCIEHHAQASSKGAMTKGLEPSLLRKYKNHWESVVSTTTNILTPQRPTKISKAELTNIRFEVKREIFRIPTLSEHQTRATLDYLQYLNYETHNSNFIIKDIGFIHWFMEAKHLKIVAEQVYDLFLHLVGPHMVALRNVDRREMSKTIELLADLGVQAIIFDYKPEVIKEIGDTLKRFQEIAGWYKDKKIEGKIREAYQTMYGKCEEELKLSKSKTLKTNIRFLQEAINNAPAT